MKMKERRKNGEGSWGKKNIKGNEYLRFTKSYGGNRKEFYGETVEEVNKKRHLYEQKHHFTTPEEYSNLSLEEVIHIWLYTVKKNDLSATSFDRMEATYLDMIKGSDLGCLPISQITFHDIAEFLFDKAKHYFKSSIDKLRNLFKTSI